MQGESLLQNKRRKDWGVKRLEGIPFFKIKGRLGCDEGQVFLLFENI